MYNDMIFLINKYDTFEEDVDPAEHPKRTLEVLSPEVKAMLQRSSTGSISVGGFHMFTGSTSTEANKLSGTG